MRTMLVIARRELWSAAISPVLWFTVATSWFLAAAVFFRSIVERSAGDVTSIIAGTSWSWLYLQMLVLPVISMRLLSEERRSGTFEALMTAPVHDHEVVLGKFLAANVIHAVAALIVPILIVSLMPFGARPDVGQVVAALVALVGAGAAFLGVGIFASSLTASQMLAAFLGLALQILLLFGPHAAARSLEPTGILYNALMRGDFTNHIQEGSLGIIDANTLVYQAAVAAVFLLFATRTLETRKWK